VLAGIGLGDQRQGVLLQPGAAEIDLGDVEVDAQNAGQRLLVDKTLRQQDLPQRPPLPPLLGQRRVQLLGREQALVKQQLPQPFLRPNSEAAARLRLGRAQRSSPRGASSWRRISVNASGVKRR
jgi:hypothetical protein